jgi:hypothetical protein
MARAKEKVRAAVTSIVTAMEIAENVAEKNNEG